MTDDQEESRNQLIRPAHYELFASTKSEGVIRVVCNCLLGEDHSYGEWVTELGEGKYKGTAEDVDADTLRAGVSAGRPAGQARFAGPGQPAGPGQLAEQGRRRLGDGGGGDAIRVRQPEDQVQRRSTRLDVYVERMIGRYRAAHETD